MPNEQTFTIQHVVAPFTDVSVAIRPAVLALALFRCILVETLVLAAIIPFLFAEAVLFVLVPIPHVLRAVGMPIDTEALSHIINEFALVEITTCMVKLTSTIIEIGLPEAFVDCAIGPSHNAISLLHVLRIL